MPQYQSQYRLAQAVLAGKAKGSNMSKSIAQEMVDSMAGKKLSALPDHAPSHPSRPGSGAGAASGMLITPSATSTNRVPGLTTPGNIDLTRRPTVRNPDGSISTVRSMSFGNDSGEILVPTVTDDARIASNPEAIQNYRRTGRHLGTFSSPSAADLYATELHNDYALGAIPGYASLQGLKRPAYPRPPKPPGLR